MSKTEDIKGGLRLVTNPGGPGHGWYVLHTASNLPLVGGALRQKRFAAQSRDDFLALGIDYTLTAADLRGKLAPSHGVYALWRQRARQDFTDPRTGEHYSQSTHYGQFIPSAAQAENFRATLVGRALVGPVDCDRCTQEKFEKIAVAVRGFSGGLYCERCAWIFDTHEPTD